MVNAKGCVLFPIKVVEEREIWWKTDLVSSKNRNLLVLLIGWLEELSSLKRTETEMQQTKLETMLPICVPE